MPPAIGSSVNAAPHNLVAPQSEPPATFSVGEVLGGSYRVKRRIAVGGMGEVYLCRHTRLPGNYVAKVLARELDGNGENYARFRREAEIVAALQHPNVVQVLDFNVTPSGSPYLIMEYLNGKDLGAFLAEQTPHGPRGAVHIIKQVASALQAAHDVGIVHRDLKPENIVLISSPGQENFVKVIDFGISISSSTSRLTAQEVVMGTPHFMSPEQAQGEHEVDGRSDQFSLATLAYLLLVGTLPFDANTPMAVLYNVVNSPPRPTPPELSASIVEVLMRALSKDRDHRYSSVIEFAEALEVAVNDSVGPLPPSSSTAGAGLLEVPKAGIRNTLGTTLVISERSRAWTTIGMATFALALATVIGAAAMSAFGIEWQSTISRTLGWLSTLPSLLHLK